LLLTATIDPRGTPFVRRADPLLRLRDYQTALGFWLADPQIARIILCENSGYDLAELRQERLHILSYRLADHLTARAKGYGELDPILRALEAAQPASFLKVTGRYYVANMGEIAASIRAHPEAAVISCATGPPHGVPSECFFATAEFIERYFAPY